MLLVVEPGHRLDGDTANQHDVLADVDDAHAALTNLADDTVVRDGAADHKVGPP
jgi:hypothetical protein